MPLFKKRETVTQNIAYMAIMAAINVVFVLLTAVLPPLMFLIIFILPLTSTVVTLFCQKKYFPIYAISTIVLCLIVTSGIQIFDTFFYVIPALITGFIFGILIEKKVPALYIITISNLLQYALTILTFFILNSILAEMNFVDKLLNIMGMANFIYKDVFLHAFLYLISAIQVVLTYGIMKLEIKKLGFEFKLQIDNKNPMILMGLILLILSIIFGFIYLPLSYVFLFVYLPLFIYQVVDIAYQKNIGFYICLGIIVFSSFITFVLSYALIDHPYGVLLLLVPYIMILFLFFMNKLFIKMTNNYKMK